MIIGLDRAFKPEWVYKIVKLSKPGLKYKDLEQEFNSIIEVRGLKSKKNIMTIIRRYYLKLQKKEGEEYFANNYLQELSTKYSFDSMKPILIFTLLCRSEVARFIQDKINLKYLHNGNLDRSALYVSTMQKYGDRRIVKYVVGYYLKILEYFDIIKISGKQYEWKSKKMTSTNYMIKDMILLYGAFTKKKELTLQEIVGATSFTFIDLSHIEDVLREFNAEAWNYQKRIDSNRIIITAKIAV
jgi:hypothetical protein